MRYWRQLGLLALASLPFATHAESYTCVSFEYPPLIHRTATGSAEGLAVEIANHVFRQMGATVRVEVLPWARALAMAKLGLADCIFTLYHSPERELFLDYSNEPIVPQVVYLYARTDVPIEFNGGFVSLLGFRIGVALKINYGPKFEQARVGLLTDEAPTIEQNFMKLGMGRVDVVPSNAYTASYTLAQPSMQKYADHIVRLPTPIESVMSYIAFPKAKNLHTLRDRFDVEMRKFVQSGTYQKLLDRYDIENLSPVQPPKPFKPQQ